MNYILSRIKEPSSWAGLSAIALGAQQVASNPAQWWIGVGVMAGGVVAFLKGDPGSAS